MNGITKIMVDHGVKTEIVKTLNVTQVTVRRALSGTYPITAKALKIRKIAIEKGGVEVISQMKVCHE